MPRTLLGILIAILALVTLLTPVYLTHESAREHPRAPAPIATLLIGGDMMFDRYIRTLTERISPDWPFSCIDNTLASADLVVANLEGPITDNSPSTAPLTFTFPPATADALARHNVRMVNIGNNHILNFGYEGRRATMRYLDAAGVMYFGDDIVATTSVNGVQLAFINYNEFGIKDSAGVLQKIRTARADGYVPVVYGHWGVEYTTTSLAYSHELAHSFVDAGAALVVGSHPHVIQDHERYGDAPIYYSVGNLIFDQYFSDEVRRGLLLKVTVIPAGVQSVEEIPVVLTRDGRTCLVQ